MPEPVFTSIAGARQVAYHIWGEPQRRSWSDQVEADHDLIALSARTKPTERRARRPRNRLDHTRELLVIGASR